MIIFFMIVIAIAVLGICYYIFKLLQEENEAFKEEQKAIEEEEKKKPQNQVKAAIQETSFEEILEKASKNINELIKLKEIIKNDLTDAMRQKDMQKIRNCNEKLKAIDLAENNLKGN